jgi:hypothetical protein
MKIVTIEFLLEFFHLLRETIGWNASEQPELRKHLDCMVEEIRCNLKVIERSEATGYVVLERSVQVVVRIVDARHGAESMPAITRQGARWMACGGDYLQAAASPAGSYPRCSGHPGRASPSGRAGAVAARCDHLHSCRPCHPRAISSGHQRYLTDGHGHFERAVGLDASR